MTNGPDFSKPITDVSHIEPMTPREVCEWLQTVYHGDLTGHAEVAEVARQCIERLMVRAIAMTREEAEKILDDCKGYIGEELAAGEKEACLDGYFTPLQLQAIITIMQPEPETRSAPAHTDSDHPTSVEAIAPCMVDGVRHDSRCACLFTPAGEVMRRQCNCGAAKSP